MSDEDVTLVIEEATEAMDKAIRSYRAEIQKVRTGRANPALLDDIHVEYYGAPTPLNQLANVGVPDPRLMVVSPFDAGALAGIEKAIQSAGLGLTPGNDGKVIRIPIPPLTEERRKDLVKQIKKAAEEHKVGIRDARRAAIAMLKDLENDGSLPADDRKRAEKRIQELTDKHVARVDEMTDAKEEEILEV